MDHIGRQPWQLRLGVDPEERVGGAGPAEDAVVVGLGRGGGVDHDREPEAEAVAGAEERPQLDGDHRVG